MTDPSTELLDIVDGADQVIGVATRAEVHAQGMYHRAVHILVHDGRGRVYVQRRSELKDCQPGLWDTSAAGHVDHGEAYDTAAARELAEELGLSGMALEPVADLPADAASGFEFVRVYIACANAEPVPDTVEIAEARWCEWSELKAWVAREPERFTPTLRHILAEHGGEVARTKQA